MFPMVSSSLKSFLTLRLFCAIVLIDATLITGIGSTDYSYNDLIVAPRSRYDDAPSPSSSIVEQCTYGLPCHVLTSSIRTMRGLVNELEIASKQHCQRPHGSEIKSSRQPSRRINDHLQRLRNQKPPLRSSPTIRNLGQSVGHLRQDEESHFTPRQLLRQLPLERYQREPSLFRPTGQTYAINPRQIRNLNQSLQLPVAGKFAVKKLQTDDELSSFNIFDTDSKRTKRKKKMMCSRRSDTGKKEIEPNVGIQEAGIIEESSDQSNNASEAASTPKNEREPVTMSFLEAEEIGSETNRSDKS